MECKYCSGACKKAGLQKSGLQKYQCRQCKKYQQQKYMYKACQQDTAIKIINYVKESCGIRSISRLLKISATTVICRIRKIAKSLRRAYVFSVGLIYEMDELYTYIQNKKSGIWVIYSIERKSRKIVDLLVSSRTKESIKKVVDAVLAYCPKKVNTDKLNIYPRLIKQDIHKTGRNITNRIERYNLTLRTHLKRLSRSSICFSKKADMLEACLRIYFWG